MWNWCLLVFLSLACNLVTKTQWWAVRHWWTQKEFKLTSMLMSVCTLTVPGFSLTLREIVRTLSFLHCISVERASVRESKVLYLCSLLCKLTFVLIHSQAYCSEPILLSSTIKVFLRCACITAEVVAVGKWLMDQQG